MTAEPHWEHFEDARGAGVTGVGGTLASAFSEAARGLTALVTDPANVALREDIELKAYGDTPEALLLDWLNVLIREMDARRMLFGDFELYVGKGEVVARVFGEAVEPHRHHPAMEPTRALTVLEVRQQQEPGEEDTWVARGVIEGIRH